MVQTATKFCTLDAVKAQLNNAAGFNGDDPLIDEHIKVATALVRNFCRRDLEEGTYTEYFNTHDVDRSIRVGRNIARFTVKEKPLQSITSVTFNTAGRFADTEPLEVDNHYYVDLDRHSIVFYPGVMRSEERSLKVVYVGGYPVDDLDADILNVAANIASATAIQAAFTVKRVLNETQGSRQKQDRKGFVNYGVTASGLVSEAQAMLRGETRLLVGGHG